MGGLLALALREEAVGDGARCRRLDLLQTLCLGDFAVSGEAILVRGRVSVLVDKKIRELKVRFALRSSRDCLDAILGAETLPGGLGGVSILPWGVGR